MELNALAKAAHALATKNGFHPEGQTEDQFLEATCNNMHDEVSELHEAWRNNRLHAPCDKAEKMRALRLAPLTCAEEELADIIIRACDTAFQLGIDIDKAVESKHNYNRQRAFKHGGKKS